VTPRARPSRARRPRPDDVVIFLGPSLPAAEARQLAPCRVLPPARAGDLFAVLPDRPLAIALVDGAFEFTPSVWHHEILAALAAGVAVFGGGSMGALRAAELAPLGMVGIGRIYGWYRDGRITDDAEVALLHARADRGWRGTTVPLVAVRAAAEAAREARVLTPREAGALVRAAGAIFYQERTWPAVIRATRLSAPARARLLAFLPSAPDPKADDARATILAAAEFARARRAGAPPPPRPDVSVPPSHVRRRRLAVAPSCLPSGVRIPSGEVVAALGRRPDAKRLAAQGLRRALLAAAARSLGLRPTDAEVAAAERAWLGRHGISPARRDAFLAALGLDDGAARALVEDLALEARLLDSADRAVPDGPSWLEGLALGARMSGAWLEELGRLAGIRPEPPRSRRRPARLGRRQRSS
jgi:hypothetical protein